MKTIRELSERRKEYYKKLGYNFTHEVKLQNVDTGIGVSEVWDLITNEEFKNLSKF